MQQEKASMEGKILLKSVTMTTTLATVAPVTFTTAIVTITKTTQ